MARSKQFAITALLLMFAAVAAAAGPASAQSAKLPPETRAQLENSVLNLMASSSARVCRLPSCRRENSCGPEVSA